MAVVGVLGVSLLAGLAVGIVEGVIDEWFSLFIVFPAIIGAAAGAAAMAMIGRRRLRAPLLALVLGAVGGVAGYGAEHGVHYLRFRSLINTEVKKERPTMTDDEIAAAREAWLVSETGHGGFRGFLEVAARQGVGLKHAGSSDKGVTLTGTAAWLVWAFELLIAAGVAGFMARRRAREPFCETCNAWYAAERTVASGGDGSKTKRKQLLSAIESGDVDGAAAVLASPASPKARFVLTSRACPQCGADVYCTLKLAAVQRRSQVKMSELESWLMMSGELTALTGALARAQPRSA
jgi:hypothetical protein